MRRNMLGMSQKALALKIGLTFQQVQKHEKEPTRSVPRGCSRSRTYWRPRRLGCSTAPQDRATWVF